MLMPKRVKYRKQLRGRIKGRATRGVEIAYGEYGLQALEPHWITDRQIEAARVALTRHIKAVVRSGSRSSLINRLPPNRRDPDGKR